MAGKFNKDKLKAFIYRRQSNTLGLMLITVMSLVITLIAALIGSDRTDVLACVSILLLVLCSVQLYRVRKSFRTIPSFKGMRKRKAKAAE